MAQRLTPNETRYAVSFARRATLASVNDETPGDEATYETFDPRVGMESKCPCMQCQYRASMLPCGPVGRLCERGDVG